MHEANDIKQNYVKTIVTNAMGKVNFHEVQRQSLHTRLVGKLVYS